MKVKDLALFLKNCHPEMDITFDISVFTKNKEYMEIVPVDSFRIFNSVGRIIEEGEEWKTAEKDLIENSVGFIVLGNEIEKLKEICLN